MHVGGAAVTPEVAGAGFVDTAAIEEFFDPVSEVVGAEARAITGKKEGCFGGQVIKQGP